MRAKIKEVREICKETLYIEIDLLGQPFPFEAGQFFQLTLINPPFSDERGNSRYLGFVNSPNEKETITTTTRYGESAYKKSLQQFPVGVEVEIGNVGGHAALKETDKPVVLIAGGIGIVPFMSVIRFAKEQALNRSVTLFYTNKDMESAVFFDELNGYASENLFKFVPIFLHDDAWTGEKNRINGSLISKYLENPDNNQYFITGTKKFVLSVFEELKASGVDAANIVIEIFTGY